MKSVFAALVVLLVASSAWAQEAKPSLFVGPQIRDGFVDMDAGIRDSIRDIQQAVHATAFTLAPNRDEATVVLLVLARGIVTKGEVGASVKGLGFVAPNTVPTLTTQLSVPGYERLMQSEGAHWRDAAQRVVEDVLAWWDANHDAVTRTVQETR